jgi:hypothetical protein
MGLCVSTHTVEHELAREEDLERARRRKELETSLEKHNGKLILHGLLAKCDSVNRNGRVYPKPVLQREVAAYESSRVRCGEAYGRLEHPGLDEFRVVDAGSASHRVSHVYWTSSGLYGYVEVLDDTEEGRRVRSIYADGGLVGASTRSWSSLEKREDGKTYVDDDMELLAFDLVRDPATYSLNSFALMTPVVTPYESPFPSEA